MRRPWTIWLPSVIALVTQLTKWVSSLTYPGSPVAPFTYASTPEISTKPSLESIINPPPILDEISQYLSRATDFIKHSAKDGFWNVHLDKDSSYLTTFNTYKGRYEFLHMPVSLNVSQGVFQICMDQAADCLSSIIVIHNDICVYGQTPEKHGRHLIHLIQSTLKNGIVFNSSKGRIRQSEISFYGAVFTSQGMNPDPTKAQALHDLPTPDNQRKLQSFLGLINYLQPLIQDLADETLFL